MDRTTVSGTVDLGSIPSEPTSFIPLFYKGIFGCWGGGFWFVVSRGGILLVDGGWGFLLWCG